MLKESLIIWSKLQMKYLETDTWEANAFNFLNEQDDEFTNL